METPEPDLAPLASLIEARRHWLRGYDDMVMSTRLLSFNIGRQAGHTHFIAQHAKPGDVVVLCLGPAQQEHFRALRKKAGQEASPKAVGGMGKAARWLASDEVATVGDLWIDEPAWSGTRQTMADLLKAWAAKRTPDSLAITMGGVYRIA